MCQKRRRPSNQHPTEATTGHSWSSSSAGRLSGISPRRRVTLQMSFSRRHPSPAWTEWGVSTRQHGRPPWQNLSPSLSDRPPARHNTQDSPRKKAVVDSSEYSGVESFSLPPFAIKHTMGRRRRRWVGMEWGDFGRPRKTEEKRDGQERRRRRRHYVRREWRENDAHLLFCFSPSLLLLLRRIPPSDVKSCTLSLSLLDMESISFPSLHTHLGILLPQRRGSFTL